MTLATSVIATLSLFTAARAHANTAPDVRIDATTNGAEREAENENELPSLVESYFKEGDARQRKNIASKITSLDDVSVNAVANAIRSARLWENKSPGIERFVVPTLRNSHITTPIEVYVRVPKDYDSDNAYPLLLSLPDRDDDADALVERVAELLGDRADSFLMAVPMQMEPVGLSSPQEAAGERAALLRSLRRRYHVDTDRVYLLGAGLGGHAAITWATLTPDYFAGVVAIEGTLTLQLPGEAAELFLQNLRQVPTVLVWGGQCQKPNPSTRRKPGDQAKQQVSNTRTRSRTQANRHANDLAAVDTNDIRCEISAWNRYIARIAERDAIPVRAIEISAESAGFDSVPNDTLKQLTEHARPDDARKAGLWFRYPSQGRIGWLRQTRFLGEPWTAQRIQVAPAPTETKGEALRAVLTEKLAYIGGEIEGQTVRVTTRRTEKIEVRLNKNLIDLDKDITIIMNGTRRFEGRAAPSIRTMLETAQADWEFQQLWSVRFQIDHKGRAIQR